METLLGSSEPNILTKHQTSLHTTYLFKLTHWQIKTYLNGTVFGSVAPSFKYFTTFFTI